MTDATIAAIARRVAVHAAINGYERRDNSKIEYLNALTELCAAVRAEREEPRNYPEVKANQATKETTSGA